MAKCFKPVLGLWLAAAALYAAGPSPAPRKVTMVVRPDTRTGRLVRSAVVTPRVVAPTPVVSIDPNRKSEAQPAPAPAPSSFREAVEQAAYRHALPAGLLHSIIKVESNYNPYAVSPKGAMGLMQLIPSTARRFGVSDAFNPLENLDGGARYLRYLMDLYGPGNYPLVLAAYNAGEGAVARYGGVPPYEETRNYLLLVKRAFENAKKNAAPAGRPEAAESGHQTVEVKPADVPNRIHEIVEPDGRVRYVSR